VSKARPAEIYASVMLLRCSCFIGAYVNRKLQVTLMTMFDFIRHHRRGMNSPANTESTLKRTRNNGKATICLSRFLCLDTEFIRWRSGDWANFIGLNPFPEKIGPILAGLHLRGLRTQFAFAVCVCSLRLEGGKESWESFGVRKRRGATYHPGGTGG
jgi:hypothetical protein